MCVSTTRSLSLSAKSTRRCLTLLLPSGNPSTETNREPIVNSSHLSCGRSDSPLSSQSSSLPSTLRLVHRSLVSPTSDCKPIKPSSQHPSISLSSSSLLRQPSPSLPCSAISFKLQSLWVLPHPPPTRELSGPFLSSSTSDFPQGPESDRRGQGSSPVDPPSQRKRRRPYLRGLRRADEG